MLSRHCPGQVSRRSNQMPSAALGGIIWRTDSNSIRLRQYAGSPANMLRIKVGGKDDAFRYETLAARLTP
jgi:hypothetical protein